MIVGNPPCLAIADLLDEECCDCDFKAGGQVQEAAWYPKKVAAGVKEAGCGG